MAAQIILANNSNLLSGATLASSSVRGSALITRSQISQAGNGQLTVTGPYTGAADATLDIEIVNDTVGSTPRHSAPRYTGVGQLTVSDIAIDGGASAQRLRIVFADAGIESEYAELVLDYGIKLRPKSIGADGNDWALSIDRSGLSFGTAVGALLAPLSAGQRAYDSDAYNFGAVGLDSQGRLPASAPRLVIGPNWPVYRHWRERGSSGWRYFFDPAPPADIPAGTLVQPVTGTVEATLSNGVDGEVYTAATLYELFLQIQTQSLFIDVIGALSSARTPGSMALADINLITTARAQRVTPSGSHWVTHLADLSLQDDAATQTLRIECIDNQTTGAERWRVSSSLLGVLDTSAYTAETYSDASSPASFVIPRKLPPDGLPVVDGSIAITERRFQPRQDDSGVPDICLYKGRLGGAATPKTLRLRWTKRPDEECSCEDETVTGLPSANCLGISLEGDAELALDTEYQTRLTAWYAWRSGMYDDESPISASSATARSIGAADPDMQLVDQVTSVFMSTLAQIYSDATARAEWDSQKTAFQAEIEKLRGKAGSGASYTTWVSESLLGALDFILPTTRNGHYYANVGVVSSGNTGSSEPTWPTDGSTVVDGDITWQDMGAYWPATTAVSLDHTVEPGNGHIYKSTTAGTTGGTEPYWSPVDATISDGSVVWTRITAGLGSLTSSSEVQSFVRRAQAAMDHVLTLAGIVPKDSAGADIASSPCWSDTGDPYYWQIVGTDYLPAFNNVYYHSAVLETDPDTDIQRAVSTQEFGFALRVGCPERLQEDDEVIITIADVITRKTYTVGDAIEVEIIAGDDLPFSGGVTGDDTHTWVVSNNLGDDLDDYVIVSGAPPVYADGDVAFKLNYGAIPPRPGDVVEIDVEGGHFRYRFDGGSWSSAIEIAAAGNSISNGLTLSWQTGVAPSVVAGDSWQYSIRQPYGLASLLAPRRYRRHEWSGSSNTITLDLGSSQAIGWVALALHTLPSGTGATLRGGADTDADDWSVPISWREHVMCAAVDESARYLALDLTDASGGGLGWLYIGPGWQPALSASDWSPELQLDIDSDDGGSLWRGDGFGGRIAWRSPRSWLSNSDMSSLKTLLLSSKRNNDEPIVLIPNPARPVDALLARIDGNAISLREILNDEALVADNRRFEVELQLAAVLLP